jgi:hypothetical protein
MALSPDDLLKIENHLYELMEARLPAEQRGTDAIALSLAAAVHIFQRCRENLEEGFAYFKDKGDLALLDELTPVEQRWWRK